MMHLLGRQGKSLIEGTGTLRLDEFGDFQFELTGTTVERQRLENFLAQHRRDPYDGLGRFRLIVETPERAKLHCGFVAIDTMRITSSDAVECSGYPEGLSFDAPSIGAVGTEILILVPKRHWLSTVLTFSLPPPNDEGISRKTLTIRGSALEFEFEPKTNSFTIAVIGSDTFLQTYTEGWLSEPLRLMLGQLVFPRIIVRSNPDRAIVFVSQIRPWHTEHDAFSLFDPAEAFNQPDLFFEHYAELLGFVANEKDGSGNPVIDRQPLTFFYEELAQAMRGSRWIMTMTLASAVEGVLELLFPAGVKDESLNPEEIADLKAHIDRWPGHNLSSEDSIAALKNKAKGSISHATILTATKRLRLLVKQGKIERAEMAAWEKVRNKVAHGKIFPRFSSADSDQLIENLMSLFRKLAEITTRERGTQQSREIADET